MTAVVIKTFDGMRPALSNRLLDGSGAQVAEDSRLDNGQLRAWREEVEVLGANNTAYTCPTTPVLASHTLSGASQNTDYLQNGFGNYDLTAFDKARKLAYTAVYKTGDIRAIRVFSVDGDAISFLRDIDLHPWPVGCTVVYVAVLYDEYFDRLYVCGAGSGSNRIAINGKPVCIEVQGPSTTAPVLVESDAKFYFDTLNLPDWRVPDRAGNGFANGSIPMLVWNPLGTEVTPGDRPGIGGVTQGTGIIQYRLVFLHGGVMGHNIFNAATAANFNSQGASIGIPYSPDNEWIDDYHFSIGWGDYSDVSPLWSTISAYLGGQTSYQVALPDDYPSSLATAGGGHCSLVFSKERKRVYASKNYFISVIDLTPDTGNPLQLEKIIDIRQHWTGTAAGNAWFSMVSSTQIHQLEYIPELDLIHISSDVAGPSVRVGAFLDPDSLQIVFGPCHTTGGTVPSDNGGQPARWFHLTSSEDRTTFLGAVDQPTNVLSIVQYDVGFGLGYKTIYRKGSTPNDTRSWMVFRQDVDIFESPVVEDQHDRVYWSGQDFPRYAPWLKIREEGSFPVLDVGGTVYNPGPNRASWKLGVPPPTFALTVSGGEVEVLPEETYEYIFTFYSPTMGESCASDPVSVKRTEGYDVTITFPATVSSPVTDIEAYIIYRKKAADTTYLRVGFIDADDTSFIDKFYSGTELLSYQNGLTSLSSQGTLASGLEQPIDSALLACVNVPTLTAYSGVSALPNVADTSNYTFAFAVKFKTAALAEALGYSGHVSATEACYLAGTLDVAMDSSQSVTGTIKNQVTGGGTRVFVVNGRQIHVYDPDTESPGSEINVSYIADTDIAFYLIRRNLISGGNNWGNYVVIAEIPLVLSSSASDLTLTITPNRSDTGYAPLASLGALWAGAMMGGSAAFTWALGASSAIDSSAYPGRRYVVTYTIGGNETGVSAPSNMVLVATDTGNVDLDFGTPPAGAGNINVYRLTQPLVNGQMNGSLGDYRHVASFGATANPTWTDVTADSALGAFLDATAQLGEFLGPSASAFSPSAATPLEVIPESRSYVYTYVSAYGEEGPPSPPSEVVDVDPSQTVTVSGLLGTPSATLYNITKKRIYRTSSGTNLTTFQFVAEIDIDQATYEDSIRNKDLGEVIPSIWYYPPPAGGKGLCLMANGIGLLFHEQTIYPSELFLPHAWNPNNTLSVGWDIVGIGTFGQTAVILTTGYPYLLTGVDPSALSLQKLEVPQACASKRSIVEVGDGVIYASPDGLVMIGAQGVKNLTRMILHRDQWQAYNPWTMHCYVYNERVFVFHDTGLLIFDFTGLSAQMVTSDTTADSGFYDMIQDALFLGRENEGIFKWDTGDYIEYTWRSKVFQLPSPTNFAWAQVEAESYPVVCRVFNGNNPSPLFTKTVQTREPFRLPSGSVHRDWYVELQGTPTVYQVQLADHMVEIQQL